MNRKKLGGRFIKRNLESSASNTWQRFSNSLPTTNSEIVVLKMKEMKNTGDYFPSAVVDIYKGVEKDESWYPVKGSEDRYDIDDLWCYAPSY